MSKDSQAPLSQGAFLSGDDSCLFRVWAPKHQSVALKLSAPVRRTVPMEPVGDGYHEVVLEGIGPGARYVYGLTADLERPDPASRSQPDGVHAASEVARPDLAWTDRGWRNPALDRYVIYELHVGTYSTEGTFDGVVPHLENLRKLGITAIELMPIAQFPGSRNWGYDGVYPYAAQSTYGGVEGLKRLVNAAHHSGLAVVLDVVYNHLGPEGNYLGDFGPYFSSEYSTPWGHPFNFDGPGSDHVRRYFIDNALYWLEDCHIDALRLDAIHAIFDFTAMPFLRQLADEVHERAPALDRNVHLIAESALNDPRVVHEREHGGLGMDAHWNDDFHHALHVALTGEQRGYYSDFMGLPDLVKAINEGYVYQGQYSEFRGRSHGAPSKRLDPRQLVVFSQNHDQIGNRSTGDRLTASLDFEQLKLAAGTVLLSPFVPLLFMGEEYAESAPFPYFISHEDNALIRAVRMGRRQEFAEMLKRGERVPDPQSERTFQSAKLNHGLEGTGSHASLRRLYQELIRLRTEHPALQAPTLETGSAELVDGEDVLVLARQNRAHKVLAAFNFSSTERNVGQTVAVGDWKLLLDSADVQWDGPTRSSMPGLLSAHSFQVFERSGDTSS